MHLNAVFGRWQLMRQLMSPSINIIHMKIMRKHLNRKNLQLKDTATGRLILKYLGSNLYFWVGRI